MDHNNFIVSARKYRPTTFSSVVGQKNLTATLRNAIATDRLAHSYLFCGSRGVGKTSCARIFAKTINCEHRTPQGDPCNECPSCRAFNEGRSLNIIELDAASNNGVEDMRSLTEQVMVPPTDGKYRVFIIDEVHMLSSQAFNAFLKTLEEPPSYIIFILATTEKQKILPTILSRCQIYDFNRITVNDIVDHLSHVAEAEGITAERKALSVIATQADGAMRDALSIFDQIVASTRGNVTYESTIANLSILDNKYFMRLMDSFAKSDVAEALLIFKEIRDKGFNTHFFIQGLQAFIRDLMVARDSRTLPLLDATDDEKKQLAETAARFSPEFYFMGLSLINDADLKYREASNKTFLTELLLIKLCQLLSPSPVFRGKEEGHIDSLLPLGKINLTVSRENILKAEEKQPEKSVAVVEEPPARYEQGQRTVKSRTGRVRPVVGNVISLNSGNSTDRDNQKNHIAGNTSPQELTQEMLDKAWKEFMGTHKDMKNLVNLMNTLSPKVTEPQKATVKLILSNTFAKECLERDRAFLAEGLKELTGVADINFVVEIVEDNTLRPEMWNDREVLENMLANHPEMASFINDLSLTLS